MPFIDGDGLEVVKEIFNTKYANKNADGAVVSIGADYAEYADWADGNPSNENRRGYFVTVVSGSNNIQIADSNSAITGVITDSAGFIGNYSAGAEADASKGLVGIIGQVLVIDNGTCEVGQRCMPTDDGTAAPSDNTCGYKVIERIDSTHVRIMVAPALDMIQRIKTDMIEVENALDGKADVGALDGKSDVNHNHSASNITAGTLPVARGGTGATTAAAALTNLGIGDKIESQGTTSSWRWVKYTSGLCEAWITKTVTLTVSTKWGGLYYATTTVPAFPFTFKSVIASFAHSNDTMTWVIAPANAGSSSVYVVSPQTVSSTSYKISFHVVGTWK